MTKASLLLSQAVEGFLLARAADGYSPQTISQYRWALERLINTVQDKSLDKLTVEDLRRFLAYMQNDYVPTRMSGDVRPLSSTSIFHAWKAIRAFYKWAVVELAVENISLKLPQPKHAYPVIIPFSDTDIKALLKTCEQTEPAGTTKRNQFTMSRPTGHRDRAIILTLLDTGVRVSELCRLDRDDVDLEEGQITIRPYRSGIKSKARIVPLGSATRKAVWRYMTDNKDAYPDDPAFCTLQGRRLNRDNVLQRLKYLGKRAGVKDCHPHRFRHTFAIVYLKNGGDVFSLQRILGHSSLEMVQVYLQLAQADVADAHRKASPVDRWRL